MHRGIYPLSERATEYYEGTREKVKKFINATKRQEIVFTKSATEAINLVAYTWGEENIKSGDEILVSILEHHSNFISWQQLAKRKGAILKIVMYDDLGRVTTAQVKKQLSKKTKLVAITHFSNVTGTILPINEIIKEAHKVGASVLVDAAQSVAHMPIDVQAIDCDWLVFSGHKMYGPTGVGVLFGKEKILDSMPPFLFGGGMIDKVTLENSTWAPLPEKFEAGTPPIAEVVALAKAIDMLEKIGFDAIVNYEKELTAYSLEKLQTIKGITILGPQDTKDRGGVISFILKGIHPHDIATIAGDRGVAIRAGHHCAQPLHDHWKIPASCRLSLAIYNSKEDIDVLVEAIKESKKIFSHE